MSLIVQHTLNDDKKRDLFSAVTHQSNWRKLVIIYLKMLWNPLKSLEYGKKIKDKKEYCFKSLDRNFIAQ